MNDSEKFPLIPLRDIVIFPNMVVPLFVGRERSVNAIEKALIGKTSMILLTQKNIKDDIPRQEDLYSIGTLADILQILKLPDGTVKVLVEGIRRVKVLKILAENDYMEAEVIEFKEVGFDKNKLEILQRVVLSQFKKYVKLNKRVHQDVITILENTTNFTQISDIVAAHLNVKISDKQKILETINIKERLETIVKIIDSEIEVLQVEKKIKNRVKNQMEKTQREYYLNEQIKAIQKELGEEESTKDELTELSDKIDSTSLSTEALAKAKTELKKLKQMSPLSAEAAVIRNYLDWLINIPWQKRKDVKIDIKKSKNILNQEHYGLENVKERIIEYLAVQSRVGKVKSQILCLVGPPGVGKTSLAKSIAKSINRDFVRISLGGVRDESEIRGHRRTYIGAMPGKIIQGMSKCSSVNPVFLVDELDKIGNDWRGDPASALLEVFDPEQNEHFSDHYIEVDYDLSDVMFIATANTLDLPSPLLDRMEIIRISGYTEDEKVEIAKKYLIQKQLEAHGLTLGEFSITDRAILKIVRDYTRESGVRNLERELAKLLRKTLLRIVENKTDRVEITEKNLSKYLGVEKFSYLEKHSENLVGIVTGLAWTEVGGEILSIEALLVPGKDSMKLTGKLGDVMLESIQAAASFVKARAATYGIDPAIFEKHDIHIHVPEGATPKDGPSAGVAMVTSIVSVLTGVPIDRSVAMTGEITLRGRVLAIGGLKEKLLAAHRSGIKTVIIPHENKRDLKEIPEKIIKSLKISLVKSVDEVLEIALKRKLHPLPNIGISTENLVH